MEVKSNKEQERNHLGEPGGHDTHFNFQTKQGPTVSVSNMRDIAFRGCSEIMRTINFPIFAVYITIFE